MKRRLISVANEIVLKEYRKRARRILDLSQVDYSLREESSIDELLARSVVLVKAELGLSLHEEQIICALSILDGNINELPTGEGKTLSIAVAAAAYAFKYKKAVHIATVNEYLAERDMENMSFIFEYFNLTYSANKRMSEAEKVAMYKSNIVYSSAYELIFDYIRQDLAGEDYMPMNLVIIDEVDFVLVDNANSNFSVTSGDRIKPPAGDLRLAKEVADLMIGKELRRSENKINQIVSEYHAEKECHYVYNISTKSAYLTDKGYELIEDVFSLNVEDEGQHAFIGKVIDAVIAKTVYVKDVDYLVENGEVLFLNRNSGRVQSNAHFEQEIQMALEAKEGVEIQARSILARTLSYQVFFSKYELMTGVSGTVEAIADEMKYIFDVGSVLIPPHKESIRIDHPDQFCSSEEEKCEYLIEFIEKNHLVPVMVVAADEGQSWNIYKYLEAEGHDAILLNNFSSFEEEKIIREFGKRPGILVTTPMSGRGTDISISIEMEWLGGLQILVWEHFLSSRIDRQVSGRAGRQGISGACTYLVSFGDRVFEYVSEEEFGRLQKEFIKRGKDISWLRKRVEDIQCRYVESGEVNRKLIYELSYILDVAKQGFSRWGREIAEKYEDMESFLNNLFDEIEIKDFDRILTEGYSIDELKRDLIEKEKALGALSKGLFRALVGERCVQHWSMFEYCIENLRRNIYGMYQKDVREKFVEIVFEEMKGIEGRVMEDVLAFYLMAQANPKKMQ